MSTPKKIRNPLSKQGDMKMLTLNDFAEDVKNVCPETIYIYIYIYIHCFQQFQSQMLTLLQILQAED